MKSKKLPLLLLFAAGLIITSCGNQPNNTASTETTAKDDAATENNEALDKKMKAYVEAINAVNKPLNDGYNYYLKYVDEATGQVLNKHSGAYFMPEIQNTEAKLGCVDSRI